MFNVNFLEALVVGKYFQTWGITQLGVVFDKSTHKSIKF